MRLLWLLLPLTLMADISTQTQKSDQKSDMERKSLQQSEQLQKQKSQTLSKGEEKSQNRSFSQSLAYIRSSNYTIARNRSGTWTIQLNPIPYILMEMENIGWNEKAFYLANEDIGTTYYLGKSEEFIDLNAKEFYTHKAQTRGNLSLSMKRKVSFYINLLYFTGMVADKAASYLKHYPTSIDNFPKMVRQAVISAYRDVKREFRAMKMRHCRFGGNIDTFICRSDKGVVTLIVTNSIPTLLINGAVYYSATDIGFTKPMLTVAFSSNTNEALSRLAQDTQTATLTKLIRDYTNKLESEGKSKIASEIKARYIEKALTSNITTQTNAIVNAINSGSPIAVLNIFK